jgi:iron complex outermembrane receptor protein
VYLGGDWGFRSKFFAAVNLDPFSEVPARHLVGLHAGIRNSKAHWDLSLWGRNVFDTNYYNTVSLNASYGVVTAALGEPRTFGATFRAEL